MNMVKDSDKDEQPIGDTTGDSGGASERDEYGDTGGPVDEVDPDALVEEQDQIGALEHQLGEMEEKYKRALAEQQNVQRRAVENEREARRQGVTSVVRGLLGVLDNFDLALSSDPKSISAEQMVQGVRMIQDQFLQALARLDVARIAPEAGDEFDPHRHEAVQHLCAQGIEPGRIAAMLQAGYALGERVLRPAKVALVKEAEGPGEEADSEDGAGDDECDGAGKE